MFMLVTLSREKRVHADWLKHIATPMSCLILRAWYYDVLDELQDAPKFGLEVLIICMHYFQALLHSVPLGKLIVLDLYAEVKPIWATSKQFYGIPYIWKVTLLFFFCASDIVFPQLAYYLLSSSTLFQLELILKLSF